MTQETEASVERQRLARAYPPRGSDNPLAPLAPLIRRDQWQFLRMESPGLWQTLAIAPGLWRPRAAVRCFPDGSALVTINEGLVAFLQAVADVLASGVTMRSADGLERAPSGPAAVNAALLSLYRQWDALQQESSLRVDGVALPVGFTKIADGQTRAAVFFFLMHEYAHVALHAGLEEDEHGPAHELEADSWAVRQIVLRSAVPRSELRILLAGILLAVRVLHALEVLGHRFPGNYPTPAARVNGVLQAFADLCPARFSFYYFTTIAYATDQRMEAAERELQGLPSAPEPQRDTILATVMGVLIEVRNGRMALEAAVGEIAPMVAAASPQVLVEVGACAATVFTGVQPHGLGAAEAADLPALVEAWHALLAHLPEDHRRPLTSEKA